MRTSTGYRGGEHTILLGAPPLSPTGQGSKAVVEQLVSVGKCVKVTEAHDRLSGPALGTVLGGAAAAVAVSRVQALRLVSIDAPLSEPAEGRALRGTPLDPTLPLPPVVRLQPVPHPRPEPSASSPEASARSRTSSPPPAQPFARPSTDPPGQRHDARTSVRSASPPRPADSVATRAEPRRPLGGAPRLPTGSASRQSEPTPASVAGAPAASVAAAAATDGTKAASSAPAPRAESLSPSALPARELFRQAALEARQGLSPNLADAAEPKLGAWGVLALLLSLVAALFCGAGLLSVEVTVRAPGALRAPNGLRSVESVLSGALTEVLVQAGDEVTADQVVARLEETQLRATLTLRERELATLRHDTDEANRADASLLNQTTIAVQHQRAALARRGSIHENQLRQRSAQLENVRAMRDQGVASGTDQLSGEESVQAAAESIALVGSQLAELNLSLADRKREWKQRELERNAALSRAIAAVDEAKSLLALTEVRSPASGRVESLLVTPGAVVQPGRVIAQIVPKDAPRSIVAFLPSREMAFVSVGSQANVEVESLPVNEFGMARARVKRISADIAKPEEMATAFGEAMAGSFVRVELELVEDANQAKMAPHLRSGERVLVRLHRREQRVLSLIFEFTRKWLGW